MLKQLLEAESYQPERMAIAISQPEIPAGLRRAGHQRPGHRRRTGGPAPRRNPRHRRIPRPRRPRAGAARPVAQEWLPAAPRNSWCRGWPTRSASSPATTWPCRPQTKWNIEMSADAAPFNEMPNETNSMGMLTTAATASPKTTSRNWCSASRRTVGVAEKSPQNVVATELLRTTPNFYAEKISSTLVSHGQGRKGARRARRPAPAGRRGNDEDGISRSTIPARRATRGWSSSAIRRSHPTVRSTCRAT